MSSAGAGPAASRTCGPASSHPRELTALGPVLYFSAYVPGLGDEPWRSDGTPGGTRLVRDLLPGEPSPSLAHLEAVGGRLFFTAREPHKGHERWTSDGTRDARPAGRGHLPGPMGSAPGTAGAESGEAAVFARAGSYLFFSTESFQRWSMLTGACCPVP